MEADIAGKDEENFAEEIFGELNQLFDEIDNNETKAKTSEIESESNSPEHESVSLSFPSVGFPSVAEKTQKENKSVPAVLEISSQNEFDEELINLCESIEREDFLGRQLRNSAEIAKDNENSSLRDPVDDELPEVPSKDNLEKLEDNDKSRETVENVESPNISESANLGANEESLDSDKEFNVDDENVILAKAPIDSAPGEESTENMEISLNEDSAKLDKAATSEARKKPGPSAAVSNENSSLEMSTKDDPEPPEEKRVVTPEKIIDLLKKLSPEKLQVIKSQVFNKNFAASELKEAPNDEDKIKTSIGEDPPKETKQEPTQENSNEAAKAKAVPDDDCVILIDSDDEPETANDKIEPTKPEEPKQSVLLPLDNENAGRVNFLGASNKRKCDESKENPIKKILKKTKECVNPDCSRESEDFLEAHLFLLNFYRKERKMNKPQYVCSMCYDKAMDMYEQLGAALLNNKPIFRVPMHSKEEMVEILDSDDEDEETNQVPPVSEADKIDFNIDIELEIENVLEGICNKIDLRKQLVWEQTDLEKRCKQLDDDHLEFEKELNIIEKKSSAMYNDLYSINKPKFQRRKSVDIVHKIETRQSEPQSSLKSLLISKSRFLPTPKPKPVKTEQPVKIQVQQATPVSSPLLPPAAPLKIVLQPNTHFAVRSQVEGRMQHWASCKLTEVITSLKDGPKMYRVQFSDHISEINKVVKGNELASNKIDPKLKIGARVIAQLSRPAKGNKYNTKKYLPGVIGEKLSKYNKQRYLVFFDYGQVQYVSPEEVREILESSENVWEDVHENLRQFIFDYLQSQTMCQRALLNVRVQQQLPVERHGAWRKATVVEIDCSVVKMRFPEDNSVEWIYRGSKRLGPLFTQGHRSQNMNARRNDPNISYITIDDDFDQSTIERDSEVTERSEKNTARKSTGGKAAAPQRKINIGPLQQGPQPQPPAGSAQKAPGGNHHSVIILNDNNIYLEEPKVITKFRHFTPRANIAAKKYVEHNCSPLCLPPSPNLANHSPLSKPLLTCWERLIVRQKNNRWVQYKAPCGRRLRDMFEIRTFLLATKCALNVDNFDFDVNIQVLYAYDVIDKKECPLYIPDMSEGKEGMKIPVINAFDDTSPPKLEYSAVRIPMNGVNINTDPEFMACCDCVDDCADKTKCACFQMTIQGYNYAHRGEDAPDEQVSYVWKRLSNVVTTGIYECNVRCKCSSRCLNKVVQHPIQVKMQLFRTKNRGWGLESCHDIPRGSFICIYAGRLYKEDDANALCQGENHGDEYFAELDLIETAQPLKEDFEAGVIFEDSDSEDDKASDSDSDYDEKRAREDGEFLTPQKAVGGREIVTRSTRGEKSGSFNEGKSSKDSDSDDEMVNMVPTTGNTSGSRPRGNRSLRKLYGKNEKVFIMDAKLCGNVGRYFNHSCDPNLMVQSVFVDTHDMRFPWIAFFATRLIKAGEELTWNYNYEVGSVPSKVLYCICGAKNCRGRIL